MPQDRFLIRAMQDDDGPAVLGVINKAFGRDRPISWFEWKHRMGPWGPSVGWVAETDEGEILAVRLFTPWELRHSGQVLASQRAMDGAVAPKAQRQGLFSRTVHAEMSAMSSGGRDAALTYSTSVPASREAYRKIGWTITHIPHRAGAAWPSPRGAADIVWGDALGYYLGTSTNTTDFATNWTASALRWRIDRESGLGYRTARLRRADDVHGAIVRVASLRGIRTLVLVHAWGERRTVKALVRAIATRLACLLVLESARPGLFEHGRTIGGSTVSLWGPDPALVDDAATHLVLDFADLEGVM